MKISDLISQQIYKMIEDSKESTAEIQRNEMAALLGCVPSQINYVLSSRFTPEQGYIIESRRGGGGYIKITRIKLDKSSSLMHIVNSIGSSLDAATARVVIENCVYSSLIDDSVANLMLSAISNTVIRQVPVAFHDKIRAAIIKQMLISQI